MQCGGWGGGSINGSRVGDPDEARVFVVSQSPAVELAESYQLRVAETVEEHQHVADSNVDHPVVAGDIRLTTDATAAVKHAHRKLIVAYENVFILRRW